MMAMISREDLTFDIVLKCALKETCKASRTHAVCFNSRVICLLMTWSSNFIFSFYLIIQQGTISRYLI